MSTTHYDMLREFIPKYNVVYTTRWSDNQYVRKSCVDALMKYNITFGFEDGYLTVVDADGNESSTANSPIQDWIVIVDPTKNSATLAVEDEFHKEYVPIPVDEY